MPDLSAWTESLCPHCLCRIKARRLVEQNSVFLEKTCPTHGSLEKVLLWNNTPYKYTEWNRKNDQANKTQKDSIAGCPTNCGLCSDHLQKSCTVIIEVTHQCNLYCPVCFAAAGNDPSLNPDRKQIAGMLQTILDRSDPCPVQFSGGEPTIRDDLPEIISLARSMGFDHVQVNTNGIRMAQEAHYAQALKDAGVSVVFLQFDGLPDDVHMRIRGAALSKIKQKAIDRCEESKLGVILVPTLVRGINEGQIGPIIQFAKDRIPTVKGVHFQPMAFLGRYPEEPANQNRILIPDILTGIEVQTRGELKTEQFIPPGCEEPHCSFSAFSFLDDNGNLVPTTQFLPSQKMEACCSNEPALESRQSVSRRWKYRESDLPIVELKKQTEAGSRYESSHEGFLERVRSYSLCVSGMAFQDAWNIDLERLRQCCVHVVTQDSRLVPFCAYYMTGSRGQHLYQ